MARGRKANPITAHDIANTPVEQLAAEAHTKGSYKSYIAPFIAFAIKKNWTGKAYSEVIDSKEPLTAEYVQQNNIKPICSSMNVEIYIKEHLDKHGRRRGEGIVSRSIADQYLKSVQHYRLLEASRNLYKLQTPEWQGENFEFTLKSGEVLRNQTVLNLLEGFSKRQHRDKQIRCVDTQSGKRHLNGHELLLEARWSYATGTDQAIRTHAVITLSRSVAFRIDSTQQFRLRGLKYDIAGSVASGLPEIPALLFCPDDSKENHVGKPEVTGCIPHTNPLLCCVSAIGQILVQQFHPKFWNRDPPDMTRRERWFNMPLLCTFQHRNAHDTISTGTISRDVERMFIEAFRWPEERVVRELKGVCNHLGRYTNAAETSDANVPDSQGDRIGGWASREHSRRESCYLRNRLAYIAARVLAGTPGNDVTAPHRLDHIPNATRAVPSSATSDVPDSVDDILPSVPMQFITEWAPFFREWNERLTNEDHEVWREPGADNTRISATNFVNGGIFSIKVFACSFSVLREQFPRNPFFNELWATSSDEVKGWTNQNKLRWQAACETTRVAQELEEAGRDAEARSLRCMESHMQLILEAQKNTRSELLQQIELSQQAVMAAIESSSRVHTDDSEAPQAGRQNPVTSSSIQRQNIPDLPVDLRSAQTFVPTLDDLDKFDRQIKRGYGCENAVKWNESRGRAILEQLGDKWWLAITNPGITREIRNNVLAKRWKRIQELLKFVDKSSSGAESALQKAMAMDRARNIRFPDMKLGTWLELEILVHTTTSTAQEYQDCIRKACRHGRTPEWIREASSVINLLSNIIGSASARSSTTQKGRTKLDAMVELNQLEARVQQLLVTTAHTHTAMHLPLSSLVVKSHVTPPPPSSPLFLHTLHTNT